MEERKAILLSEATIEEIDEELHRRKYSNIQDRFSGGIGLFLIQELSKNMKKRCEKNRELQLDEIKGYAEVLEKLANLPLFNMVCR